MVSRCARRVQNAPRHRLFVLACFVAERRVTALPPPDEKKCSSQCSVLGHVGRSAAVVSQAAPQLQSDSGKEDKVLEVLALGLPAVLFPPRLSKSVSAVSLLSLSHFRLCSLWL